MKLFRKETDLCDAYIDCLPKGWTPYAETGGFDLVLVHETGFQIGIEAKLTLNPKVILQAAEGRYVENGPDARAVLVPTQSGKNGELALLAGKLGITVIYVSPRRRGDSVWQANHSKNWSAKPALPKPSKPSSHIWYDTEYWWDRAPVSRIRLPEYVPDVKAGASAPMMLSDWKIKAIKICVLVDRISVVTRAHFRELKLNPNMWMNGHWLKKGDVRGEWVKGPAFPVETYQRQHPEVFKKIEADFSKWSKPFQEKGLL